MTEDDNDNSLELIAESVSDALSASASDLLTAVDNLEPQWVAELEAARAQARQQQAAVLSRRVDLLDAFKHGAKLTDVFGLGPTAAGPGSHDDPASLHRRRPSSPISALACSEPAAAAIALRNISHTLHLVRFLEAAPGLIASAMEMLDRVAEADAPSSSDLYQAHENICVCERVRDYTLLDALPNLDYAGQVEDMFKGVDRAREQLEYYLMANIFSAVPRYAHTDPRLLVAAVRIVQRDSEEDAWWENYLERSALQSAGTLVRPEGRRNYEKRMHQAIVLSIDHTFNKAPPRPASVDKTLRWIKKLVVDEHESRRFVVPCFPPSYCIGDIFTKEYHRCIMALVTELFRDTGDRRMLGDDEDSELVKIVEWYREYRYRSTIFSSSESAGEALAVCLELPSGHRDRLVAAVSRHGQNKLRARVVQVVSEDKASIVSNDGSLVLTNHLHKPSWHKAPRGAGVEAKLGSRSSSLSDTPLPISICKESSTGACSTGGPEQVFGAIGQQIRDAKVLGVPEVNTAMASVVATALLDYQRAIRDLITADDQWSSAVMRSRIADWQSDANDDYICATANNMARCLEYAEELRDALAPRSPSSQAKDRAVFTSPKADEASRTLHEESSCNVRDASSAFYCSEQYDAVIEGFRNVASIAVAKLVVRVCNDIEPRAQRFFAPRTGTEVMLDVIQILSDFFARYKEALMPYHFECLAVGCLRRLVGLYLTPFTSLEPAADWSHPMMMSSMGADAVVAQLDKDVSNLRDLYRLHVTSLDKKQLEAPFGAIGSVRDLFVCRPTTHALAAAHVEAVTAVARLQATINARYTVSRVYRGLQTGAGSEGEAFGVSKSSLSGGLRLTLGASEAIWSMRRDLKQSIVLEAVARLASASNTMDCFRSLRARDRREDSVDDRGVAGVSESLLRVGAGGSLLAASSSRDTAQEDCAAVFLSCIPRATPPAVDRGGF